MAQYIKILKIEILKGKEEKKKKTSFGGNNKVSITKRKKNSKTAT